MAYATATDVSDRLGRPLTDVEQVQVAAWLEDVSSTIEARFTRLGFVLADRVAIDSPSLATLVRIESEVVIRRLSQPRPGGPSSVTRSIDDGSLTQRWERPTPWTLTDEEWADLLPARLSSAFSIRPGWSR